MATLECNNTPTSFSNSAAQENGEALPEEKSLSIDYSEDLWLANSEDSSGGYAQHSSGKSTTLQETASGQASMHGSYQNSISSHTGETAMEATPVAGDENFQVSQHHWSEIGGQNEEEGATVLQPSATTFLNGNIEQNGMEFHNSSGDEKDFAQLVPAGTYVETGDAQDKTYTAMMPAAGMGVNGQELSSGFTTMLNAAGQQMVFYGSGEDVVNPDSSHMMTQQTLTYAPSSNHMTAVDSQDGSTASGEDGAGEGNLYVAMETTDTNQQQQQQQQVAGQQAVVAGGGGEQFAVLNNGRVVVEEGMKAEGQVGYVTSSVSGSHQTISTLPFLQNGAFPTGQQQQQASFNTSFNQSNNGNNNAAASVQQPSDASQAGDSTVGQAGNDYGNHSVVVAEEYEQEDENSNSREAAYGAQDSSSSFHHGQSVEANGDSNLPAKSFVCETCQKSFATGRYLKYHRKNHCKRAGSYEGRSEQEEMADMEVKRFACNICQRPFRVLKCMRVHKKKKHGIMKDFTCPSCAVSYNSSQELADHLCQPKSPPAVPGVETTTTTIVEQQQHQQQQQRQQHQQHQQQQQPIIRPPPPSAATFLSQRKKKKLRQVKPCCDICGKLFGDRISLDIHRVKHIEEEFYPCDMCPLDLHAEDSTHLAVHFRIKFFTDDNQHILDDQKAATEAMHSPIAVPHHRHHLHHHHGVAHSTPIRNPSAPNASLVSPSPSTPVYSNPSSIIATAAACTNIIDHSQDDGDGTTFVDEAGNYTTHSEYSTIKLEDASATPQQDAATGNFYTEYASGGDGTPSQGGGGKTTPSGTTPTTTTITTTGDDGIPVTKTILRSKPHICNICNKSFTEAAKLEIHYQSNHVEDRPFQCEICDKSFFTKWKLQRHMLSHLEQKPHSCPACSKSFVERGKLEAHYRTHLGTKPYKCEYCPKAFTVKSQLTIHVRRIHSADQPFGCEICGKAFLWRSGLEKHMRKHTREKPYSCSFCGQKYSQKSNLISHLAKVHNHQYVEPEQDPESQQEEQLEEQQQLEGEEPQQEQPQQQQQPQGEQGQ